MSTEGTALEGLLRQEREAQEKAAARAANGEIDGTESAQNGTDQQSDAPNALAALEAKVYAEIEKKKQASMARNVDGNKTNSADHPKATA